MLDSPKPIENILPLPETSARRASLIHTSDEEPGIRRKGGARRFYYIAPNGKKLGEGKAIARHRRVSIHAVPQQGLTLMILRADGAGARHVRLSMPLLLATTVVAAAITAAALGIGWQIGSVTAGLGF